MTALSALVWGASGWLAVAVPLAAVIAALLTWGYWRSGATPGVGLIGILVKVVAVILLALCLLEPLLTSNRARPGANLFVVLADNSQSMTLRDRGAEQSRADQLKSMLPAESKWLVNLRAVYDLRQYAFDTQLKTFADADELKFDGGASNLGSTLDRLVRRYQGRPLAGVLLMTDGSATDAAAVTRFIEHVNASANKAAVRIPPIYPVLLGGTQAADDVSVGQVAVTQTSFEDAPVTVTAQVTTSGYKGRPLVANLLDESGTSVDKQTISAEADGEPISVRFRVKPQQAGVSFYRVAVAPEGKAAQATTQRATNTDEATLANNTRLVAVDCGRGPYRVLYVSGRPNWEFKFLRRSLTHDPQVHLVGLMRIAKREPKFTFLGRGGENTNPLFRGFDPADKDAVEQYDQPVIVRFGTKDENELRGGFPKTAEELFGYHALVIDDLEAEFFTQDQMQLIKDFVRQRGGGLLMLGGQESFKNGKYERTPIGDMLPVYVDAAAEGPEQLPPDARYRLRLTREGLLEPWVRLRADEDAERRRLNAMPAFETLNPVRGIKPGATVLATAQVEGGGSVPALVEQRFGQGRVGAMLIGDVWRWGLRRPPDAEFDMEKSWRQTIRRLVADVPERVGVTVAASDATDDQEGTLKLRVAVRDAAHAPLDNATITLKVTGPDGKPLDLSTESSAKESGVYEAAYVPRLPGAYRVEAVAAAADGSEVGKAMTGWTSEPAAEEFRDLKPNRALLDQLARATGGQTVEASKIEPFVATLPTRHAEITEPHIRPAWHQPWVFALAICCLCAEWGLRRWKGMP